MSTGAFLKGLLLRTPQEIVVALVRAVLLVIVLILVLVLKLWEWLLWLFKTKTLYPEEAEDRCGKIPEVLVRRPDPCIYSQTYLAAQGLPVTWNNPDIWVAPAAAPGQVEPDSYQLKDDTDYIVSVRAHNASTDPAIGVRVRLVYRPWSFNSPDATPVEVDAAGNEVVNSVDIPAMGATVTQFRWHTPPVAAGESAHYCLQAHLSHPLDVNTANNMGQENTRVYSQNPGFVTPGEIAQFDVPLFNTARREQRVRFIADRYQIDLTDRVELKLERRTAKARYRLSDRLGHALPTVDSVEARPTETIRDRSTRGRRATTLFGQVTFSSPKSRFALTHTRYLGLAELRQRIVERDYSLPVNMVVTAPDAIDLEPTGTAMASFEVHVPADARPGDRIPMNIRAETDDGTLVGGVTVYFEVEP